MDEQPKSSPDAAKAHDVSAPSISAHPSINPLFWGLIFFIIIFLIGFGTVAARLDNAYQAEQLARREARQKEHEILLKQRAEDQARLQQERAKKTQQSAGNVLQPNAMPCADTDNQDIFRPGVTSGLNAAGVFEVKSDTCVGEAPPSAFVREYYCDTIPAIGALPGAQIVASTTPVCPFGCRNGACLRRSAE